MGGPAAARPGAGQGFLEDIPSQHGTLDANRVLHDALQRHQVAELVFFGFDRTLVAEIDGSVVGQIIRFSGADWNRKAQTYTGLVVVRAAGWRFGYSTMSARTGRMPV